MHLSASAFQSVGNLLPCAPEEEEDADEDAPLKAAATRWQTQFNQDKTISGAA